MPLLAGDIRFARSINMQDVPEGGGPPSSQLLTSGKSNEIFPDLSEETRTVGRVEIYQIFSILQNADRAPLLGANAIIAEPPADPNVSITMLSLKNPFATRAEIAKRVESGMNAGSEWSGYLLENHFTTMRAVQLLQRPGMPPPAIGKTYVLVYQEGTPSERRQRIRIKAVSTEERLFTTTVNGQMLDFLAQVSTCEIFDGLAYDFPGSPPSRYFARDGAKTMVRETIYTDAGLFYSASRLTEATEITDVWLRTASVYTQVVPNSKTEAASVDQRPGARHTLTLAESPRRVEVGITPHTQRVRIDEINAGLVYVFQCRPLPAPGTIFIDYWALGQRYTITDDPADGKLTGQGGGAVSYLTGAINVTLKAVPDIGSAICLAHGSRTTYVNRSGQGAQVRPPEYALQLEHGGVKPGTLGIEWTSGGTMRSAADSNGTLTGDASGEINYASGDVFIRPAYMPDAGAQFAFEYETATLVTKSASVTPDAGGYDTITLDSTPAAGSVTVQWTTVREVSSSSGASASGTSAGKQAGSKITYKWDPNPDYQPPVAMTRVPVSGADQVFLPYMAPGGTRVATGETVYIAVTSTYSDTGYYYDVPDATGVVWSETEFGSAWEKSIGGTKYKRWGAAALASSGG